MAVSLRNLAVFAAVFVVVVLGGASDVVGQGTPSPTSTQRDPHILEGIVLEGDSTVDAATVILHRVSSDSVEASGEVESTTVGRGGAFRFSLPSVPDADIEGDIYFASVDYQGVLYFGTAITTLEQLDSLYEIRVFQAEAVPPEGVPLSVDTRDIFIEYVGDGWVVIDLFVINNPGTRTLVAPENGVVWSYPLPLEAVEPVLGESDMTPDAVTFEGGRVRISAPLPPGTRMLIIQYRLEGSGATIPAPGITGRFELMVKEPSPPLQVEGLAPIDIVALEPGSSYRRFGGTELVDVNIILVETEAERPPPLEWLALLAAVLLAAGGFLAYRRPRRRAYAGQLPSLDREALILEVARIDNALEESAEFEPRSELLDRRVALLAQLRSGD